MTDGTVRLEHADYRPLRADELKRRAAQSFPI